MRFARLAYIQAFATALSFLISIILAWQGFEYWALVWKELTRAIFVAIGTWLLCHWLPGLPKFTSGIGLMLRTGQHVTGFNIVYFFSRNLDQILLGRFWGPEPVGLYRQAGQLLLLPISLISFPLTYVMTPALSALQGEPERYCRYYKKVVAFLSFCYMPVIACLAIFAESFTGLILGQKWIAASSILRVLALATFIESVTGTCGIVMVTHGRTKAYFYWGVIHAVCLCVAFCIGVNWGPSGVAVAYVACTYATLLPLLWVSFKDTPISISVFFEAISLPILSSVIMGLLLIMIRYIFKPVNALEELGFSLLIAPPLYFGAWAFIPGGKQKLIEHFSYLRLAIESLPFFSVVKKS
jgi:O-antigen/teichoic acid export membrane protein